MLTTLVLVHGSNASEPKVWCGLSINKPLHDVSARTVQIAITVTLLNEGTEKMEDSLTSTKLFINGEEMKDWSFICGQGPRPRPRGVVQPGKSLDVTFDMTDYFKKNGTYKLLLKGKTYQSAELTFRVIGGKDDLMTKAK